MKQLIAHSKHLENLSQDSNNYDVPSGVPSVHVPIGRAPKIMPNTNCYFIHNHIKLMHLMWNRGYLLYKN